MRQLLTESVLLSTMGGLLGLAMAPLALRVMVKFAEGFTTRAAEVRVDLPVLFFALGVSLLAGILFGLAAALAPWQRNGALHSGSRGTATRGRQRLRGGLVVAQVSASFILLIGAGLMMRSFLKLQHESPGIDTGGLLTLRINPGANDKYHSNEAQQMLLDNLLLSVKALPSVESAAFSTVAPFSGTAIANGPANNRQLRREGEPLDKSKLLPAVDAIVVDADYFATVKQPLVRGRYLSEHDDSKALPAVVINQSMAQHRWGGADPVGRRVTFDDGKWWTIAGVVGDAREYGLDDAPVDTMYFPRKQGFNAGWLVARTATDPRQALPLVRAAIRAVDPLIAIDSAAAVEDLEHDSILRPGS